MKIRYKLICVLRNTAARMFQINLASKSGKAEFLHCGAVFVDSYQSQHTFQHRDTKRFYHLQSNYCVIIYEQTQ